MEENGTTLFFQKEDWLCCCSLVPRLSPHASKKNCKRRRAGWGLGTRLMLLDVILCVSWQHWLTCEGHFPAQSGSLSGTEWSCFSSLLSSPPETCRRTTPHMPAWGGKQPWLRGNPSIKPQLRGKPFIKPRLRGNPFIKPRLRGEPLIEGEPFIKLWLRGNPFIKPRLRGNLY